MVLPWRNRNCIQGRKSKDGLNRGNREGDGFEAEDMYLLGQSKHLFPVLGKHPSHRTTKL